MACLPCLDKRTDQVAHAVRLLGEVKPGMLYTTEATGEPKNARSKTTACTARTLVIDRSFSSAPPGQLCPIVSHPGCGIMGGNGPAHATHATHATLSQLAY